MVLSPKNSMKSLKFDEGNRAKQNKTEENRGR